MPTLLDIRLVTLHSQHSIDSHDLSQICALANAEGMVEAMDDYRFKDFLGLTIHLFVTTQSQATREQLALHLPKFGSEVVLPLLKVICRMSSKEDLLSLAQQSLKKMALYPRIIGLGQVLDREVETPVRTVAIGQLLQIIRAHEPSILLLLPRLVSQKTWHLLKLQLLQESPYPRFSIGCDNHDHPVQLDMALK
ncbi:MAG: hypothetical protein AAGF93_18870 [Cyanobacteria bacterium P01_H01_bin.105]